LFLFCRPFIVRTVTAEAERITNDSKLREHMNFIWYSFAECVPDDAQVRAIEERAAFLEQNHTGELNDCRILAEVEACDVPVLVTFDTRFKNISARTQTFGSRRLLSAGSFWQFRQARRPGGRQHQAIPLPTQRGGHGNWSPVSSESSGNLK